MYEHKNGVFLRKAEPHDLPSLLLMKQETWWGTHSTSIINSQDQEGWFNNIPDDCLVLVGETKDESDRGWEDMNFLGVCIISNIDHIARRASISGAVDKSRRSTETCRKAFEAGLDFAFEMLNLFRLEAEVAEYNYPAQQIEIQHLGFTIEGIKRASVYKAGKFYNSIVLGMLYPDWRQTDRVFRMNWSCNKNFDHDLAHRMSMRSRRTFGWKEPGL